MKINWGFATLLLFCLCLLTSASAAAETGMDVNPDELDRMSDFLSDITRCHLLNADAGGITRQSLIDFAIQYEGRKGPGNIGDCELEDCDFGTQTLDEKYVRETAKKIFDIDFDSRGDASELPEGFYDGKLYHFELTLGDISTYYHARVKDVFELDGLIKMTGEIYIPGFDEFKPAAFEATVKPWKYDGRDTWALVTLKSEVTQDND